MTHAEPAFTDFRGKKMRNITEKIMKQPCKNCPFLKSVEFPLSEKRVKGIISDINNDKLFYCHATIDYRSEEANTKKSAVCFGSALFLENTVPSGCRANFAYRVAIMCQDFKIADLRKDDSIYGSEREMIDGCKI